MYVVGSNDAYMPHTLERVLSDEINDGGRSCNQRRKPRDTQERMRNA